MEGRTRLAIGAAATSAASIAVVCAVAFTNSVALADSPATAVTAARITIPSSGLTPAMRPLADAGQQAPTPAPVAVTVEAPAPEILNAGSDEATPSPDEPVGDATGGVRPAVPVIPPGKAHVAPGSADVPPGKAEVPPEKADASAESVLPTKPEPPGQAKKDDRSRDSSERRDR